MSFAGLLPGDRKFLSDLQEKRDIEKSNKKSGDRRTIEPCLFEKFTITSNKKDSEDIVNLTGGFVRFMYYESLLSNTIQATYTYLDTGDTVNNSKEGSNCKNTGTALEKLPIVGGEVAEIKLTDNRGNTLEFSTKLNNALRVNKPESFDDKTTQSAAQLQLTSQEFFDNELEETRVVKCYEGQISTTIDSILKECLKTEKSIKSEQTGSKDFKFTGNTRKPFYCINNLSTKAVPQGNDKLGNSAGFLFWETTDGYNFKSLDSLLGQKQKKSIIYNDSTDNESIPANYDLKALEFVKSSGINLQGKLFMGAYATKSASFSFYDPDLTDQFFSSSKKEDGDGTTPVGSQDYLTLAGEDLPNFSDDFSKPSRITWQVEDTGSRVIGDTDEQLDKSTEENFDWKKIYNQSIMRYNQLFASTITVTVGGDFSLHAGDAVYIDGPSLKAETTSNIDVDKKDGGVYIIADLAHYVSSKETYTKLNLIRDSVGRKGKPKGNNYDNILSGWG
tara:strand:- start:139 stop:1647 length:1509 start_codon:yes stop_codon:yes gene_type:complete